MVSILNHTVSPCLNLLPDFKASRRSGRTEEISSSEDSGSIFRLLEDGLDSVAEGGRLWETGVSDLLSFCLAAGDDLLYIQPH